jgi:hypothetical protein
MSKNPNPRSVVKNPNNPAYKAATDNRSRQLNEADEKFYPKVIICSKNKKSK